MPKYYWFVINNNGSLITKNINIKMILFLLSDNREIIEQTYHEHH